MVTKIKPRRIKTDTPGSLGDFLGYQDEANFLWGEGGGRYTAGRGIAILDGLDYSAMRGPCDEGFHVPMRSEGNALCNILTNTFGFVNQNSTLETYVKMPMAGKLSSSDASYFGVGQHGYYRTCETLTDFAYYMYGGPLTIGCDSATSRSSGNSIRQFKDTPVIPDGGSTWTTIYDGSSIATGAGIFHNTTSGIISLSGDGINWITIADKNLGATQVYNNGDTLSESNCGKYYQWGNNYGFDGIGGSTPTTSATKVDASSYGPGNFYSSSTYITTSASPYDWSSVQNNNLRGGVTGVQEYHNAITNTGVISSNDTYDDIIYLSQQEYDNLSVKDPKTLYCTPGAADVDNVNTKYFYITNASDTVAGQAIVDWYLDGKYPIVKFGDKTYLWQITSTLGNETWLSFKSSLDSSHIPSGDIELFHPMVQVYFNNSTNTFSNFVMGNAQVDYVIDKNYVDNSINTKTFYLSSTSDIVNAQYVYNWYNNGKNPLIVYNDYVYVLSNVTSNRLEFRGKLSVENQNSSSYTRQDELFINFSDGHVTSVTTNIASVGGSYLRLGQTYTTPYVPTLDGEPTSKKYVDEHGPCIPVYYYNGDFNNDITFNIIEGGEYSLYVRAYHGTTVDKTLTLTVDGVTVGTLTSNLIEHLNAHINFTASAGSVVVLSVSSKTNFAIQEVYVEKVNIQSGYLTATVN